MANWKFLSGQLGGIIFTATSTQSGFPLVNLQTYFAADQWKSDSVAPDQVLNLDLGTAAAINAVVIGNHNIPDTDKDLEIVVLEYDTADNPAFTSPATAANLWTVRNSDPCVVEFTEQTKRYWRIRWGSGASANLTEKPEIGNVFIGDVFELVDGFEFGFNPMHPSFKTNVKETKTGAIRTRSQFAGRQLMKFKMRFQNDTFLTEFQRFLEEVNGMQFPFYSIDHNAVIRYVHFGEDYAPPATVTYGRHHVQSITLKKQLVG